ncbi:DHA2 family efflux MFS transporter permease subunit [Inquilinus sp. CA228]|uniref:DHA2 family efflux MFS transporter permease subunit n=1 Tax=Inquilinus sp. CA228 TaxID=3455609 RepID=UPI003F8D2C13
MTAAADPALSPAGPAVPPALRRWLLLGFLTVAAAMDAVNSTVLVVTRGHVMGGIHATQDEVAWVNIAYLAAKLTALPLAAWLTLRLAPRRLLAGAILVLLAGALGAAAAGGLDVLVAWRMAQGVAGAVLLVAGQTLLFEVFPRSRQGLVQAVFAFATTVAPTTLSPALQGWTVDTLSWSWMFLANVPLGLAGLAAVLLAPGRRERPEARARFDWPGLVLLGAAMTAFVYVTQEGSRYNWFDEPEIVHISLAGLGAAAVFLACQAVAQKRGALIDASVFRDEHFSFGFIVSFVAGGALFGSAFVIPAFATGVLGLSPTYAGLLLLPSGALVCVGLLFAGAVIQFRQLDPVKLVPFGIVCFMTSMWMLSGSTSESGLPDMVPALLLRGLGLGLLFVSLTVGTLRDLRPEVLAQGVALFNIGRQMGGQIGVASLATYLDHQNALNRTVLAQHLAPGNPVLTDRQETITTLLTARGYPAEEAGAAATAVIQNAFVQQVATLSFNECFLAIALLFLVAAPVLVATKLTLARVLGHAPH